MSLSFAEHSGTLESENDTKGIPIRSISRALLILQLVNRSGSASMMEISQQSGLPYPSVCRIIQTLVHEGMLEREPARKHYRPAQNVQSLSYGYQDDNELVRVARPHIENLTRKIGWPISIVTRIGNHMVLRDSTHSMSCMTFARYYPGYTLPVAYCADGKAYLSALPPDELNFVVSNLGPRQPTQGDPKCLLNPLADLDEIRNLGYCLVERVPHTATPGKTSCLSMPLFSKGRAVGAVTIAYFATSLNREKAVETLVPDLRDTQSAINEALSNSH